MKQKFKKWISFFVAAILVIPLLGTSPAVSGAEDLAATAAEVPAVDEAAISNMVSAMTTEERIAQMLMPAFRKYNGEKVTALPQDIKDVLGKYSFAGVCLFAENFSDTEQSVRLADAFQSAIKSGAPQLFLSTDQEGGRITRLNSGTQMPGNMALAATGDENNAVTAARVIGEELHAIGINTDLAPVIDVNNNPSNPIIGLRSFSDDPETVAGFGKAYLSGLAETGTIGAVKHFPGHGDTATDSHTGLPCINKTYDELKRLELVPYAKCLENVEMLMTAHIQYPKIETETYRATDETEVFLPATLSKRIITDVLRNDLHYDGVVITDAMNMDAIAKFFKREDAARLAINAGVDILLMPVTVEDADGIADLASYIDTLAQMVKDGDISEERVNESVKRILRLKSQKGLLSPYSSENLEERISRAKSLVGSKAHHDMEWELAKKAVTMVKNDDDALPIDAGEEKTVILNHDSDYTLSTQFALQKLKENGELGDEVTVMTDTFSDKETAAIQELVRDAKNVIMDLGIGSKAKLNPEINGDITKVQETIRYVHENGGRVTVISYSLPYDVGLYQEADAVLVAYSARGMASLPGTYADYTEQYGANVPAALYLCLSSKESPCGVLPVNIPKLTETYDFSDAILYERGFGMTYSGAPVDSGKEENQANNGKVVLRDADSRVTGLKKSYVYTGKTIRPAVKVVCRGQMLTEGKDYRISYSANKNVGAAAVKISGTGTYSGTLNKSFKILPRATKLTKAKKSGKKLLLRWKRQKKQVTGYEIRYCTDKKFRDSNTKGIRIKKNKTVKTTVKGVKKSKTYYVRIRTYKTVGKKKFYSAWSGIKKAA